MEISIVHEFLVSLIAFVVLMEIMVLVHEFGHFAVAKLFGVRVESFSLGFGPRLFGVTRGGTDFKVCLLPLGGFVKMVIRDPGSESRGACGVIAATPRWQRILIALAGPAANFVLAFAAMTFYFGWINETPDYDFNTRVIEWVVPGTPAEQAGFETGDIVRRIDTFDNPNWQQVFARMSVDKNQTVPVTVERAGKRLQLALNVPGELNGTLAGILPQLFHGAIGIEAVASGSPAATAGLRGGDAIESVDGHQFHDVSTLLEYMKSGRGELLSLVVVRNGVWLSPVVARPAIINGTWDLGLAATPIQMRRSSLPLGEAIVRSKDFCMDGSTMVVWTLKQIVARKVSATQLSGPVGIARMAGDVAEMNGWYSKFYLSSEISLNLGIVNLLPFPMLDGWLIFLLLIESALRREINRKAKERAYQAGLVGMLIFFGFVICSDVAKLPIFTRIVK
jgi:regulator of sigma E protease